MKYEFYFLFLRIELLKSLIFYDLDLDVLLVFFLLGVKVEIYRIINFTL